MSTYHPLTEVEAKLLERVAGNVSRKWPRVNRDEVIQELWIWALKNLKWIERYRDPVSEPYGLGKLTKALYKAGTSACVREEAAMTGRSKTSLVSHDPEYSRDVVRTLLTVVWSPEDWPQAMAQALPGSGIPINDGNVDQIEEARAMLMDVANAVARLNKRDQQILRWSFGDQVTAKVLAERLDCSVDAAWKAKERSLDKLLRYL